MLNRFSQSAHIVRQLKALNGGSGLTADQYYLLKALVLANSDDLTIASSMAAANRQSSKDGSGTEDEQQPKNVRQFRDTISRALRTHLEMTSVTSTPCCCSAVPTCGCDASGMTTSSCCESPSNGNKNVTACSQLDHGNGVVVIVDNQPQQQRMDLTSCGGGCSCNAAANAVVRLVIYVKKIIKIFSRPIEKYVVVRLV